MDRRNFLKAASAGAAVPVAALVGCQKTGGPDFPSGEQIVSGLCGILDGSGPITGIVGFDDSIIIFTKKDNFVIEDYKGVLNLSVST